jgi:hypothetical protein
MKSVRNFFERNERWLTPVALVGGFVIDNLTIRRADLLAENLLLALYFLFLLGALLVWHRLEASEQLSARAAEFRSILFLAIQFVFGGLFSALTVFYIKSASITASWPFLALLFGGMIATEYLKRHFAQFIVQLATVYLLLFTYLIVIVPLVFRQISWWVFLVSALLSLAVIFGYLMLFRRMVPSLFGQKTRKVWLTVLGIFVAMNAFYFLNVIPPIPLALRESGVYKSVVRDDAGYAFAYFDRHFSWRHFSMEYSIPAGSPVFFYSSVFAPVQFEQIVVHEWQRKSAKGKWERVSSVTFPIYGGSDTGYRGYTLSEKVTPGEWRVLVKTRNGQVLGGETFRVR